MAKADSSSEITVEEMFSRNQVQAKVKELAAQVREGYQSAIQRGEPLVVVGVLKGAFVFCADLVRATGLPLEVDFIGVSSYGASTESSGVVRITTDLDGSIEEKHVLVVEDIVDTGLTLQYLNNYLSGKGARSIKNCVLLDKPSRRTAEVDVAYCGFQIPDEFVVGYGIDYAGRFRQLPYVGLVKQ